MGIQLAAGGYDFTIFDRGDGFGGTWRNNTYPGAACDVPSHFYSYSFALNPRWSKTFANQPEILAYLEKVAADHQLAANLAVRTRVTTLRWRDKAQRWTLETEDGATHQFDAVVTAVGMLDVPNIPDIPGAERFRGRTFHSSSWDHTKSTAGERVASIGTGASAIQYVPEIAAETAHLTVFQRTPIWVSPRYDEPFTPEQQRTLRTRSRRSPQGARRGVPGLRVRELRRRFGDDHGADRDRPRVPDPEGDRSRTARQADARLSRRMQAAAAVSRLVPDLRAAERHLWRRHRSSSSPNDGLRTADGAEHEVDTVIYGTGFHAADYLRSLDVYGDPWPTVARRLARRRRGLSGHGRPGLPEPVHAIRPQHQRCHLDHLHPRGSGRVRPPHPRRDGPSPGCRPSTSSAGSTTRTTPTSNGRCRTPSGLPTATTTTAIRTARSSPSSHTAERTSWRCSRG